MCFILMFVFLCKVFSTFFIDIDVIAFHFNVTPFFFSDQLRCSLTKMFLVHSFPQLDGSFILSCS